MYFIRHKGKKVLTSVGSELYEGSVREMISQTRELGVIPAGYAHRPDLIGNLYFDDPSNWWVVCEMNAVTDPFEQLKIGDEVSLPE